MMNTLEHKGYYGSAEVDTEGNALVGKLLYIRDTIAYSAADLAGLKTAFVEAVEDYLATCQALGDEPDVPCKGAALEQLAEPVQEPLTEEEIFSNDEVMECNAHIGAHMNELMRLVRAIERAHGIGGEE